MGYSITYNSGSTTPFGTFKQGTITMGLKPQEYTVSSGFTWYANAETPNDNYLIISDTYSQGWSDQQNSKPTIWRSETGTTESFVSLVNQLPDVNGVTGFTDSGTAMKYLMDSGKYFVNKDDYLGIVSDGLVLNLDAGWYPSYSGSGTTWKDIKDSNNGTLTNGPTFSTDGGGSIVFDGVDDYALTGYQMPSQSTTTSFSWNIWIYLVGGNNNFSVIFGNRFGTPSLNFQKITPTNWEYYNNGPEFISYTIPTNEWRNICIVKNGLSHYYYSNSVLVGSRVAYRTIASHPVFMGGDITQENSNVYFSSAQIYNRALSASEVLQNYNAQKGRFGL